MPYSEGIGFIMRVRDKDDDLDMPYFVTAHEIAHIAQRHYGSASDWRRIYEANRGTIANPDMIHPGQELVLPSPDDR